MKLSLSGSKGYHAGRRIRRLPALPFPKYSLSKLYLFPTYQSREEFRSATGAEAPAFSAARPPKYWFDPNARDSLRRNVVYDHVLAVDDGGNPLPDKSGRPMLDPLVLTKDEAATVNIPPSTTNLPGAGVPLVPVPLRALEADEELFFDFGGVVSVKNTKLYPQPVAEGFSAQDRQLLQAMARQLGVPTT